MTLVTWFEDQRLLASFTLSLLIGSGIQHLTLLPIQLPVIAQDCTCREMWGLIFPGGCLTWKKTVIGDCQCYYWLSLSAFNNRGTEISFIYISFISKLHVHHARSLHSLAKCNLIIGNEMPEYAHILVSRRTNLSVLFSLIFGGDVCAYIIILYSVFITITTTKVPFYKMVILRSSLASLAHKV